MVGKPKDFLWIEALLLARIEEKRAVAITAVNNVLDQLLKKSIFLASCHSFLI